MNLASLLNTIYKYCVYFVKKKLTRETFKQILLKCKGAVQWVCFWAITFLVAVLCD